MLTAHRATGNQIDLPPQATSFGPTLGYINLVSPQLLLIMFRSFSSLQFLQPNFALFRFSKFGLSLLTPEWHEHAELHYKLASNTF